MRISYHQYKEYVKPGSVWKKGRYYFRVVNVSNLVSGKGKLLPIVTLAKDTKPGWSASYFIIDFVDLFTLEPDR